MENRWLTDPASDVRKPTGLLDKEEEDKLLPAAGLWWVNNIPSKTSDLRSTLVASEKKDA